jgi:triosephosphate isomerase
VKPLIVAANWKMNKTPEETMAFIKDFKNSFNPKPSREIIFFPSFLSLPVFKQEFSLTPISYGAQNCYHQVSGAFTGEVSPAMLKSYGCGYCLVGHSERRTLFKETNEDVAKKVKALQENGITPMVCIGETLEERTQGRTLKIVEEQLKAALSEHTSGKKIMIAYEPVWAIGTGKVATLDEINDVHNFIRKNLVSIIGADGQAVPVLYGGSVNPQNAKDIESVKEVNGFLIGGASLKVPSLLEIY